MGLARAVDVRLAAPIRFSFGWWLVIAATTTAVGVLAVALLVLLTELRLWQLLLVWAGITVLGDVVMAIAMEASAPVRVIVGPGDRRFDADDFREAAVVVSGFGNASSGAVRVRGETWRARRAETDRTALEPGVKVRILRRDGLTLVVSGEASGQRLVED